MPDKILENKLYNVRPGDTLTGIAKNAKVKYKDLLELNPQIDNPNVIQPGDTIILPGEISRQELIISSAKEVYPGDEPEWFKIAQHELGVTEKNPGSNPRILEYLATTTLSKADKGTDATPWCSAFANWSIRMAGLKGTNSAWALNWQGWGKSTDPRLGAIVVFSRKSATVNGGHVGFFIADKGKSVEILGGNQGHSVSKSSFPKNGVKGSFTYKLLAYRWPS